MNHAPRLVRDFKADRMEVSMSVKGVVATSVFLRNEVNGNR